MTKKVAYTHHKTNKQTKPSPTFLTSPTTTEQKIPILNMVIKFVIAYAYYEVPFFKPDIKKMDKNLNKLIK